MDDDDLPPLSSQVHTHELTGIGEDGHPCSRGTGYERFRHRGWQAFREATYEALKVAGSSAGTLKRFSQCGSFAHAWFSPSTRRLVVSASTCHCRWCLPCANARKARITGNLLAHTKGRHLRLITLTIAHHNAPLPDLITRIWGSFKLFRRREDWLSHVDGFAAFIHVKWSEKSNWWHVHLHILAEGKWWDTRELSRAWHTVTADSFVTDIREVTNEEGSRYAARYASNPVNLSDVHEGDRPTVIAALHHRRLWLTGGSWKGIELLATEPLPPDLEHVDSLDALIARSANGDSTARAILLAIVGDAVEWVEHVDRPPPDDPPF